MQSCGSCGNDDNFAFLDSQVKLQIQIKKGRSRLCGGSSQFIGRKKFEKLWETANRNIFR